MNKINTAFCLGLILLVNIWIPGNLRADSSPIAARRQQMNDTDFINWLIDYRTDTDEFRIKKWEILSASERVAADRRLKYYRRWTELTGELSRPVEQIRLASREGKSNLAEKWLEKWLDSDRGGTAKLTEVVDAFLDAGDFKLMEEAIRRGREKFGSKNLYYRRLAASYFARDENRRAVQEYLRVIRRQRFTSRLEHRLRVIINQSGLEKFFIRKVADSAPLMKNSGKLISMAADYVMDANNPEELLDILLDLSGETKFVSKQLKKIRNQFLAEDYPELALRVHRELEKSGEVSDKEILTEAEIYLKLQRADSVLNSLGGAGADTEVLSGKEPDRLRIRAFLLQNRYDSAQIMLEKYPGKEQLVAEKIALYKAVHDYQRLAELAAENPKELTWVKFYSSFMMDEPDTSALQQLVENAPEKPETALALALSALENKKIARDFLEWFAQFPLRKKIEMTPPEKFYDKQRRLPLVLVRRWYERFETDRRPPESLLKLGRGLSFPPLLLASARRYRSQGETGRAREILEEILIEYPETLQRPFIEEMLSELEE